jgi:glutamate N-acetyltransferase/amino-acid N-acetyltransferase
MKTTNNHSVPGFLASAVSAGLNKNGRLDLSLIFSQTEAVTVGVFTTNKVRAAPVRLSQERVKKGSIRGLSPIPAMPMHALGLKD